MDKPGRTGPCPGGPENSSVLGPHATLILTLAVGAVIAAVLTALFSEVYESVVDADGVAGLDHPVLDAAKGVRSPALNLIITGYTDIGGTVGMPVLALITTVVLALRRRSWTPAILIVIAAAGSLLMTIAGKRLIGRTRPLLADAVPPYEYSASFPSGHSLNSVVIAGVVAYLVILRLKSRRGRILDSRPGRRFRGDHGPEPGLPRAPLAHRCPRRLGSWTGLAGAGHHRPPPLPDHQEAPCSRPCERELRRVACLLHAVGQAPTIVLLGAGR